MMNPLNIFTRNNIDYIFSKLKKCKSIFLQEKRPPSSEPYPYVWFQILDTTIPDGDPYYDTESVLLDTTEYTSEYKYGLAFFDGTPTMSLTNAKETESEMKDKDDLLIEIIE